MAIISKTDELQTSAPITVFTAEQMEEWRKHVDNYLMTYWLARGKAALAVHPEYHELVKVIETLLEKGGKRFRPTMTYLGYFVYGGTRLESATPIAASHELLHLSMLIHDDIIDRDTVRYGIPNVTGTYLQKYSAANKDLAWHSAISEALLAGDLVLSAAHDIIVKSALEPQQKLTAISFISNSIFDVIGGEHIELEALHIPLEKADPLLIALHKTTRYSFVNPLLSGASLAGAPEKDMGHLEDYAASMGIAFQLADDMLGIYGDEEVTGKSSTSDIAESKRSLLMQKGHEMAKDTARHRLSEIFTQGSCTIEERDEVRTILEESGAKSEVESIIADYAAQAIEHLALTTLTADQQKPLVEMVAKVSRRSA